jgi:hypothetical protein
MQISKKIPFDDPNVLNGVRALYIVSNIIIAAIYFYVQMQINKKNGAFAVPRELWPCRPMALTHIQRTNPAQT